MKGLVDPTPRMKLLGSWAHGSVGMFYLIEEDVNKDSRLTVEGLFTCIEEAFLQKQKEGLPLPADLWVQADNASGENKNRYVFGALAALVRLHIFRTITVAFLPRT